MDTIMSAVEHQTGHQRPIAHWVHEQDDSGRGRLIMVWSVPDPDTALARLAAVDA
jgi:hypothetical protein